MPQQTRAAKPYVRTLPVHAALAQRCAVLDATARPAWSSLGNAQHGDICALIMEHRGGDGDCKGSGGSEAGGGGHGGKGSRSECECGGEHCEDCKQGLG